MHGVQTGRTNVVLNNDRLAIKRPQRLGDNASYYVNATTRCERIGFTRAMTDPAKIDIHSNPNASSTTVIVMAMMIVIVMFAATAATAFTSHSATSARRTFAGMTRTTESAARKNEPRRDKRENDETRCHLANEVNGNTIAWPPGITICNRLSAVNASFGQSTLV